MDRKFFDQEKEKYVIEGNKVLNLPGPFEMQLPEIYQIEICSTCNFGCIMCPKELYRREKDAKLIDPKIIELMISREEFGGSYFVELQMTGEPLLHPDIQDIIDLIKSTGVMVGLSTNGSLLTADFVQNKLKGLDYLTLSLDSITQRDKIRIGFNKPFQVWYEHFLKDAIRMLVLQGTTVDVQFIELPGVQEEMRLFSELAIDILPEITIRTVPEGYFTLVHKGLYPSPDKGMCMNPQLSVSVQSQGLVVPCCFWWGDEKDQPAYGDITKQSLHEIWHGEEVRRLREAHRTNTRLPDICARCYLRSPTFLHTNIMFNSIREGKKFWSV